MLIRPVTVLSAAMGVCLLGAAFQRQGTSQRTKEPPQAPATPQEKEGEKTREITIKAERAKYNSKTRLTTFSGNVIVRQIGEKFTITADKVDYDEESDSAQASGHLTFSDPDTTITGDQVSVSFSDRKAVVSGNVKLTSHGKETSETKSSGQTGGKGEPLRERYRRVKTTMTCDRIEYFYSEGKSIATGNLQFTYADQRGSAQRATYLENEEQIIFEGSVSVVNEKGETLQCRKATVNIKDDSIDAEGVQALLIRKEKKKDKPQATPSETDSTAKPQSAAPVEEQ